MDVGRIARLGIVERRVLVDDRESVDAAEKQRAALGVAETGSVGILQHVDSGESVEGRAVEEVFVKGDDAGIGRYPDVAVSVGQDGVNGRFRDIFRNPDGIRVRRIRHYAVSGGKQHIFRPCRKEGLIDGQAVIRRELHHARLARFHVVGQHAVSSAGEPDGGVVLRGD